MRPFRLIQISDTHLGLDRSWFAPNVRTIARIISPLRPDLVVNTGDISFDGAERDEDLAYARGCHTDLDAPLRAIPGNHDGVTAESPESELQGIAPRHPVFRVMNL